MDLQFGGTIDTGMCGRIGVGREEIGYDIGRKGQEGELGCGLELGYTCPIKMRGVMRMNTENKEWRVMLMFINRYELA